MRFSLCSARWLLKGIEPLSKMSKKCNIAVMVKRYKKVDIDMTGRVTQIFENTSGRESIMVSLKKVLRQIIVVAEEEL